MPAVNALLQTGSLPTIVGYIIEAYLGEGGMGVVYRARQRSSGQLVALKMLSRVDAAGIYRIKREFRGLCDIIHPNLVRLLELHCEGNQWFFTMELVSGRPFLEHLGVQRSYLVYPSDARSLVPTETPSGDCSVVNDAPFPSTLDESSLRDLLSQLVRGVQAIHRANKLHCDIKPSNVLVDDTGRVVVLDFGVSVGFGAHEHLRTIEGEIAGTPEYMSPEQAVGKELGPASDWYAFGVVLYQVL